MPYWQLFYHIVWATKNREPILSPDIDSIIYGYLKAKAISLGVVVFALDGWHDHVHMVAAIPPSIAVAKFIGQVKAVAATKFNKSGHPKAPLYWQSEYAVFSFDKKNLPNYISYVKGQKEHHTNKTGIPILERTKGDGVRLIRETDEIYTTDQTEWVRAMGSLDKPH
ncbi:MAG: IS200/IS605 family transposase [Anaerolineales bacterium]|nr:IS200/IS605 family transposase [Anaerolineales bacterium]